MKKIVINECFGGFSLSEEAYEKLIEYGIPVRKYIQQERDPETMLFKPQPLNDGEVIFDRELTAIGEDGLNDLYHKYKGKSRMSDRYWCCWADKKRDHPLIIRVVEELGSARASGGFAKLKIVEIPDDVEWEISEYDGMEAVVEKHRSWS